MLRGTAAAADIDSYLLRARADLGSKPAGAAAAVDQGFTTETDRQTDRHTYRHSAVL